MISSWKESFSFYNLDELVTEGDLLDVHLSEEARRLNKTVGSLESAEFHCRVIYKDISKKFIYVFIERRLAL